VLTDLVQALPLGIVAIMGMVLLMVDVFALEGEDRRYLGFMSVAGMLASLAAIYMLWGQDPVNAGVTTATFGQMMVLGRFELLVCALLLLIGICVSLMCIDHAESAGFTSGELYALINFAVFGMMVMVTATNAVTLFIGLETMSIAIYVLAAIKRKSPFAVEAGLKYFILGAFATGFLLFGLAYVYGETGQFEYAAITAALHGREPSAYLAIAMFMLVAAFGFKIALVPFHMWTPDVYEGAPPPIGALMAAGVKTAAVIAMARLFVMAFPASALGWIGPDLFDALAILAVLTMTVGNLIALHQRNVKRMLGYSAIAHAGYLLIGIMAAHIVAGPQNAAWGSGMSAVLFYLFVYALANLGAFAVIGMLSRGDDEDVTLDSHISGLAQSHPIAAVVLAIAMLSLAGVPPTAGFFGKFVLFREALGVDTDRFLWLVIIAMLNSVVSVYYYLRVIVHAYMRDATRQIQAVRGTALAIAFVITALGSLQAGIFPARYMKMADQAAQEFIPVAQEVHTDAPEIADAK